MYVFKIVHERAWAIAITTGRFEGSADDLRDGFIHLSAGHQVAETARRHFTGQHDLLLITFRADALAPHLVWERSRGGDLFPHYYGALPVLSAARTQKLATGNDGESVIDNGMLTC